VLKAEIGRALTQTNINNSAAALEILTGLRARIERCSSVGLRSSHAYAMAATLNDLRRFREALPFAAKSVELATSHYGPDSQLTLECTTLHATTLASLGQVREARAKLSPILKHQTRVLGPEHPSTRETRQRIATLDRMSATPPRTILLLRIALVAVVSPRRSFVLLCMLCRILMPSLRTSAVLSVFVSGRLFFVSDRPHLHLSVLLCATSFVTPVFLYCGGRSSSSRAFVLRCFLFVFVLLATIAQLWRRVAV